MLEEHITSIPGSWRGRWRSRSLKRRCSSRLGIVTITVSIATKMIAFISKEPNCMQFPVTLQNYPSSKDNINDDSNDHEVTN